MVCPGEEQRRDREAVCDVERIDEGEDGEHVPAVTGRSSVGRRVCRGCGSLTVDPDSMPLLRNKPFDVIPQYIERHRAFPNGRGMESADVEALA
jgi:hypothetical protein